MKFFELVEILARNGNSATLKAGDFDIPVAIDDIDIEHTLYGSSEMHFKGLVLHVAVPADKAKRISRYGVHMTIEKVIFNDPATIVIWSDDTKTVVKAQNNETFDPEKGLAMAIAKKAFGNEGKYFNEIKKWTEGESVVKRLSVKEAHESMRRRAQEEATWLAYQRLQNALHDKKATKADLIAAMEEASGYLGQCLDECDVDMHMAIGKAIYD